VRVAKFFARLWFPLLYFALIFLVAALWIVGPELITGWRRVFAGCLSGTLVVSAASLLTKMRLQYLSAIEMLEQAQDSET
jgi:hypothetical protein